MTNLAVQIKNIWENNKTEFEKRLDGWLKALEQGKEIICQEKEQFHQWNPLRFYVSVTRAKSKSRVLLSVRFFGQEVAELFVEDRKVTLRLNKQHSKNNEKYFKSMLKESDYDWKSKEAKDFRAHFKNLVVPHNVGKDFLR